MVARFVQLAADRGLDVQLLAQFTRKRRLICFAALHLAARELPLEREDIIGASLANQQLAALLNHSGNNANCFGGCRLHLHAWARFHARANSTGRAHS